jgi:nucleoside-diphosphate-sugar epimerase
MKKVLLTGASGFIGRHCIPFLLDKGYQVHGAISNQDTPNNNNDNLFWHSVNLLDHNEIQKLLDGVSPTHLLHLAWYTEHGLFWESNRNLDWVISSLQLITAFKRIGGQRVVIAGTCAEYDWKYGFCNEDATPLHPSNLYGTSKNALNNILTRFTDKNKISYAWGRIFFLYGPYEYQKRLIPYVITSLMKNIPAECSHGDQIRDFLHVEDVANAFVTLLDSDLKGAINIGSGEPVTIKYIVNQIGSLLNKSDLIRLGARSSSLTDPPLLLADVTKLKNELHWHPKYDLDAGLQSSINWWHENLQKEEKIIQ